MSGQTVAQNAAGPSLQRVEELLDAAQYDRADSLLSAISPAVAASNDAGLEVQALHLSGYIALETGDYSRAFDQFRQALAQAEAAFPPRHPALGQAHNDLGHFFFSAGQLDSARQHHQIALAVRLEHFGSRHPKVADSYNNLGNVLQSSGRFREALAYYQKVLDIRRRSAGDDAAGIAAAMNNLGNAYLSLGQVARATQLLRQVLELRRRALGQDHPRYGRSLQNLGNAFFQAGALDSAQLYYQAALENAQLHYDSLHPQLADLYENLGNCALQNNQLAAAERWHYRALAIRQALREINAIAPGGSYLHLGDVYRQKGDYLEAMRMTEQGWSILDLHLPEKNPYLADAWEKLGLCHQALGHFLEAREAFTRALEIRWAAYGAVHPLIAGAYTNLGNIYWQESDQASASYYYREALSIWEQYGTHYQKERAELYSNIGNSHLKDQAWDQALAAYRQALEQLNGLSASLRAAVWQQIGVAYDGLERYPEALSAYATALESVDLAQQEQQKEVLFTLSAQANTLLHVYQANGSKDTLLLAAEAFSRGLDLLYRQQSSLLHTESRQKSLALHYDLFAGAIACRLARWEIEQDSSYLWQAFQLSEVSKSLRLREKWSADQPAGTPTPAGISSSGMAATDGKATAGALRKQLDDDTALLAFFAGPDQLSWFLLRDGRIRAGTIPEVQQIDELISALGQSMIQYPSAGSVQKVRLDSVYRTCARELYRRIWQPVERHFSGASKLIIVPDGALAYLPFAALLTDSPRRVLRYRDYPYLLHDYQISYAYSTTLPARALSARRRDNEVNCLAVAPVFTGHQPSLAPLSYNTVETEELARQVGALNLTGAEATKAAFLAAAPRYRVLHLATHGVANIYRSEFSYLAFSLSDTDAEGRLYVRELYRLDLPADLVVMSACESGVGRYQAGEGAISLSRGFVAAGARSILATLWSVNDAKTADFMGRFYRQLQQGRSKDGAVREVQQAYLQQAAQEDAHPFYWATYLPIGDMAPIDFGNRRPSIWIYGGGLLLLLAFSIGLRTVLLKNLSK